MSTFPQNPAFDSAFSLLRQGYRFISNQCEALDTEVFKTRLFYDNDIFFAAWPSFIMRER